MQKKYAQIVKFNNLFLIFRLLNTIEQNTVKYAKNVSIFTIIIALGLTIALEPS